MEIGDLVRKIKGYGSECKIPMVGVVVDIVVRRGKQCLIVMCDGDLEPWLYHFCEIYHEAG